MSGAAGHLLHLYENRSLTFQDLKEVLTNAAKGKLEEVTEKFDGMNIVFTWDDGVKIARNSSDIDSGGMNYEDLRQRFAGRGPISDAFLNAFKVLEKALTVVPYKEKFRIFSGAAGTQVWYSAEVIYPSGASTINYDVNSIVFHGQPVFQKIIGTVGVKRISTSESGINTLKLMIDEMQKAVSMRTWRVMGPSIVKLHDISDGVALARAISRIDEAMAIARCIDSDTIDDYLVSMAFDRGRAIGLSTHTASHLAKRLTNKRGAMNVTQLIKISPGHANKIRDIVARDKQLLADFINPIELAINDFACELLRGIHSVLINDANDEISRLKNDVNDAIDSIRSSGNIEKIVELEKQLKKLSSIDNIASAIEGIVFVFKGQAYKFTGAWAPAHQIISLYRRSQ